MPVACLMCMSRNLSPANLSASRFEQHSHIVMRRCATSFLRIGAWLSSIIRTKPSKQTKNGHIQNGMRFMRCFATSSSEFWSCSRIHFSPAVTAAPIELRFRHSDGASISTRSSFQPVATNTHSWDACNLAHGEQELRSVSQA